MTDTNVDKSHLSGIWSIWNRICQTLTALDNLTSGKIPIREHAHEDPEADVINLFEHEVGINIYLCAPRLQAAITLCARWMKLRNESTC